MKNNKGFTLIEIIAVLVIIGILAAIAVPKFFEMQATAEKKTLQLAVGDMKSRAVVAYSKSMLNHDGTPLTTEQDSWTDLGIADATALAEAYTDYAGTWSYSTTALTYVPANASVLTRVFTLSTNLTNPTTIVVTPAL